MMAVAGRFQIKYPTRKVLKIVNKNTYFGTFLVSAYLLINKCYFRNFLGNLKYVKSRKENS